MVRPVGGWGSDGLCVGLGRGAVRHGVEVVLVDDWWPHLRIQLAALAASRQIVGELCLRLLMGLQHHWWAIGAAA